MANLVSTTTVNNDAYASVPDFSLVQGGPAFRLFRRLGLCDERLEPVYLRVILVSAFTWLPLLILSIFDGRAAGGVDIPFLNDIEHHIRFLFALPMLLAGEGLNVRMLAPRIRNFVTRKIIREKDIPRYKAAILSAHGMRDSAVIEVAIIVLVYTFGIWFYKAQVALASSGATTWYTGPDGLTVAGWWLTFVSLPAFQFILVRWYVRNVIWFIFLLRVSRLDLNLLATHSDRAAGIGFLAKCAYSFSYGLIAQGALLSGFIAGKVFHTGADIRSFKLEGTALILLMLVFVLGPLLVFVPRLTRAKWAGAGIYGTLVSRYIEDFDRKWIEGHNDKEELLGTSDIQSLADISNSYSVIDQMRYVPFGLYDIAYLTAVTIAPLVPLALFVFSFEELVQRIIQILM
jgi:hypothetical protein